MLGEEGKEPMREKRIAESQPATTMDVTGLTGKHLVTFSA
jgi:hypothetical protein